MPCDKSSLFAMLARIRAVSVAEWPIEALLNDISQARTLLVYPKGSDWLHCARKFCSHSQRAPPSNILVPHPWGGRRSFAANRAPTFSSSRTFPDPQATVRLHRDRGCRCETH